jgi:hypothetical protein
MNRWIYVFICVLVVGSAAAVAYVGFTHEEQPEPGSELAPEQSPNPQNFNVLREVNEQVKKEIGFRPFGELSQEASDKAQDIANSDPVVAAVMQRLGECTPEVFGITDRVTILRYSSDEWVAQVTVDLEKEEVVAVTLNKGMLPLADVQPLVHVAERHVPVKMIGTPLLRKVSPSREGAEVVFLTDQGTVEIRVNGEEGRVIHLERTPRSMWGGHPLRWLWILIPVSAVVLILVFWAISRRPSPAEEEESPPETEAETEPNDESA